MSSFIHAGFRSPGHPVERGERRSVLLDIGRILAGTLSADDLYAAVHRETSRVLQASGFYVALYDPALVTSATIVYFSPTAARCGVSTSRSRGSESEVLRTGKPVLVEDRLDDLSLMHLGDDESEVTRSAISAPMTHKGRVLGSVSAQSYAPNTYSREDLDLLQGIADIAAVAIDNAQHIAELEKRRREAEQVEEIGRALTSSLDPKEVLGKVIQAVLGVLNVDGASVWLCDGPIGCVAKVAESGGEIALPLGLTWDLSGSLERELLYKRRAVVVDDLASSSLVPPGLRGHLEAGSAMGVPLLVGGRVAGVLTEGPQCPSLHRRRHGCHAATGQPGVGGPGERPPALQSPGPVPHGSTPRGCPIGGACRSTWTRVVAARRGRNLVVVVFDLDDFKHYNDTLGHLAGDDILRAIAQILDEENRAMNLVAWYGGDNSSPILSDIAETLGRRPPLHPPRDRPGRRRTSP